MDKKNACKQFMSATIQSQPVLQNYDPNQTAYT